MTTYKKMSAYQAAERMQTAFCSREWANVSDVIGSDWAASRNFANAEDYKRAAYECADAKYGKLPFRHESED